MKLHEMENDDLIHLQDSIDNHISKLNFMSDDFKEIFGEQAFDILNIDLHIEAIKSALDMKLKETYEQIRINEEAEEMNKDTLYDLQRDLLS